MNIAPLATVLHTSASLCSWAFSSLYPLALHSFCSLALPCCRAMTYERQNSIRQDITPLPVGPNLMVEMTSSATMGVKPQYDFVAKLAVLKQSTLS